MKLTKVASWAAVATLALGVYSAKASYKTLGETPYYGKVSVSLIVETNKPTVLTTNYSATSWRDELNYSIGKLKVNNKALLEIFADWSTNGTLSEWQTAGAQLIWDYDSEQVCVAYKDGTNMNILFYAEDGVDDGTVEAYFFIEWLEYEPAYSGKQWQYEKETSTGGKAGMGISYKADGLGYLSIYYDNGDDNDYVYLWAYGKNKAKLAQSMDYVINTDAGTYEETVKYSESESFQPNGTGSLFDNNAFFSGKASTKGSFTIRVSGDL